MLMTFIPWNNTRRAEPVTPALPKPRYVIEQVVPSKPARPYDMREVIRAVCDNSDFFEVQQHFAANVVIGFARLSGETVGVIGNQPLVLAGVLDVDSSDKAARFIRFCDAFNIPLVTLVDIPGYLPGVEQEHSGVIRHGAKILYAYSEATVPKITLILRKAYGGGYIAMCSRHLSADFVFAWPTAEIAVMGPEGAANIIFRDEITSSPDPAATRRKIVAEYTEKFANPYVAAAAGHVDAVIAPGETRKFLIHALQISARKTERRPEKKHGIPPF
jgi:acetyl-CoA carboxylase carboxyltransferase component